MVANTNESHRFQATPPLVSTDGWGTSMGTSDCQNSGSIKEVWGDVFFPFLSGFGSKSAKLNKKIPQGLLELVSSKVHAMSESPWADGQSLPWGCASITRGPWRHTSSKLSVLILQERGQGKI